MPTLYYGDNLQVMREHLKDQSVDLIYLDPPFNSKRDYNLLFKSPKGEAADASITAFEDSWHWGFQAEQEFKELLHQANTDVAQLMKALRDFLGENDMMAYLTMMANRLLEMHRVLKPTGSLYLHCDPVASHYLKLVLDGVFSKTSFRNEITWKRTHAHSDSKQGRKAYGNVADILFYYTKGESYTFNTVFTPYTEEYTDKYYRYKDPDGRRYWLADLSGPGGASKGNPYYEVMGVKRHWRYSKERMKELIAEGRIVQTKPGNVPQYKRYLDELPGIPLQNIWTDIDPINMMAKERLGYPTQKPLVLLERILAVSSNAGDVILDPFCGCGTAVHAAQKLKRDWIGIDITHLAVSLIEKRMKDAFGEELKFEVVGTPGDLDAALDLSLRSRYQFQWWATSLVNAQPYQGKKKGKDGGVDGIKYFHDADKDGARKIIVSVKSGHLKADDIRSLMAVREREAAEIGLLICLYPPTKGMVADAASAGFYTGANGKDYPRIQILHIEALLAGQLRAEHPDHMPDLNFKKAKREVKKGQEKLF